MENQSDNQYSQDKIRNYSLSGIEKIPSKLTDRNAGPVLLHARKELDVSLHQYSRSTGMNVETIKRFETGDLNLSFPLWNGYIQSIQDRHGITWARASGLLQGLVDEIIRHGDHERPDLINDSSKVR